MCGIAGIVKLDPAETVDAEDAGRNRDERADDRSQAAEEDGPRLPALEPLLGAIDPTRRQQLLGADHAQQLALESEAAGLPATETPPPIPGQRP